MGRAWRRVSEAVRQTLGPVTDKEFQATPNLRNEAMLKDAAAFSTQIKTMEKDLLAVQKTMSVQFLNLRDMLSTALPRVWDYNPYDATVVEARGEAIAIGRGVNIDRLDEAQGSLKAKLEEEVYVPMREWMKDYHKIQSKMRELEQLRLELDSRRRTVGDLDHKLSVLRAKAPVQQAMYNNHPGHRGLGDDGYDPKLLRMIDELGGKKSHKEDKLRDIQNAFQQLEETCFNSLETLILDAASLRHYAGSALFHIQECYSLSSSAFDASAANQLEYSTTAGEGAQGYADQGQVAARPAEEVEGMMAPNGARSKAQRPSAGYPAPSPQADYGDSRYDQVSAFDAAPAATGKIAPPAASQYSGMQPRGTQQYVTAVHAQSPYIAQSPSSRRTTHRATNNNAGWGVAI